jgi:multidrug efflux pump subunit AcrB
MNPARLAIDKGTITMVMTMVLLIGGTLAFFNLGRLEDPNFTIKQALILTSYPGASAVEVEQEVTRPLEIAVQQLKRVTSRSSRGLSIITVEIKDKYTAVELPQIWDELRRKVTAAQAGLPPGVGTPIVNDDYGDVYGIFFAVTGRGYTYAELKDYVDILQRELLPVKDVAKVELYGDRQEAVFVEMSSRRMASLGVQPQQIYNALKNKNLVSNAGRVRVNSEYIPVELTPGFKTPEQIGRILISGGKTGNLIRLRDVAVVKRSYVEPPDSLLRFNDQPAIGVGVSIVPGGNVVKLGRRIKKRLNELKSRTPVGIEINYITFQSDLVEEAVNGFLINLAEAVAIVIGVLMIFMGLRTGMIIGGVLVLTIAGTFVIMNAMGINLQRISLGALVLALGMLVDNAIVVAEGIQVRAIRGMDSREAAAEAVSQTAWPLLGATLVAILAFAALGMSQNNAGEFCRSLYQVMLISLLMSWFLAITVTPWLCHIFLKVKSPDPNRDPYRGLIFAVYRRSLALALRFRFLTIIVMVCLLAGSLYGFKFIKQSFFPSSTRPSFLVNYWLPEGTHIRRTEADMRRLQKFIKKLPGVTKVTTFIGQGSLRYYLALAGEFPNTSYAQLKVDVKDYTKIDDLIKKVRRHARKYFPDAQCITEKFVLGPGTSGRIRARLMGPDPKVLRALATRIMAIMAAEPNTRDIRQDWRQRVKLLRPVLAKAQAERNGLGPVEVAAAIRRAFTGLSVGVYRERHNLLPIIVRLPRRERTNVDSLEGLYIWSPAASRSIPLNQVVARYDVQWENSLIQRRDRKRTMEVICDPIKGTASALLNRLRPKIEAIELPPGYVLEWGGEYERSRDANEAVFAGFPLSMLLMVLIVIVLFNSLRQPLIIFLCIPLALIGVAGGLLITGLPLGFMAILGVLSLTGMMIKNSVVLIDQIDKEIRQGQPKLAAIKIASVSRMRPVAMAAVTTVLGLTPLILDPFYSAMAVTIMGGLSFATVLTLVVVPVLYAVFFRAERKPPEPETAAD